ncbi:phosphatase type 2C [Aphelenchoides avenae]|nr:phosphatase type 2C [Aphelenchus avenae]
MEDTHCIRVPMDAWQPFSDWSFFAVFDGHTGGQMATLAADRLLRAIRKSEAFGKMSHRLVKHEGLMDQKAFKLLREGIRDAFLTFDEESRKLCDALDMSGTAALCAFVTPTHIVLVNCGDSRAIFSRLKSFVATTDHKPTTPTEAERIEKAGGVVIHERVNGVLGLSRSLGDYVYKNDKRISAVEQLVSPEPDVYVIERDKVRIWAGRF